MVAQVTPVKRSCSGYSTPTARIAVTTAAVRNGTNSEAMGWWLWDHFLVATEPTAEAETLAITMSVPAASSRPRRRLSEKMTATPRMPVTTPASLRHVSGFRSQK